MHPMMIEEAMHNAPHAMGGMMSPMMSPMTMGHMMRPMMGAGGFYLATRALGSSAVGRLLRSPLLLLATGATLGYLAYKYRKDIVAAAAKVSDAGKDFLLQQRESLADLVAEAREAEERAAKGGADPASSRSGSEG